MDNLHLQANEDDDSEDEWNEWDRTRRVAVVLMICHVVRALRIRSSSIPRSITPSQKREQIREDIMNHLSNSGLDCYNVIRMRPSAFIALCDRLRSKCLLKDSVNAYVEEKVARFLFIVSHNFKLRPMSFFFRRSIETICRHFHSVLHALISLESEFLNQPDGSEVPQEIFNNRRYFPYFKDCIGAIDGTHIRVKVSKKDEPRFRGRKDYPTQNVLAACSFDLRFTYVLPGWEGSASDSRIIKNALTREDNLKIPTGKYYLVDAGFMLRSGLIAPYRGVRYHLKEYSKRSPENTRELFNLRHASLRNAVERAFGVLKKRFPIIGSANLKSYSFDAQCQIILACTILHNYLMTTDPDERLIDEVDAELRDKEQENVEYNFKDKDDEDARLGVEIRDNISATMWLDYTSRRA